MRGRALSHPLALIVAVVAALASGGACTDRPAPTETPAPPETPAAPPPPAASATPSAATLDPGSGLVIDDGYEIVVGSCTACHSAQLITQNAGDRAYWESLIRWMQATQNLWPLSPDVEDTILTYLAKNYGPKAGGRRAPLARGHLPPAAPLPATDERVGAARAAIAGAQQRLKGALVEALKGGAPSAVKACQAMAPTLTSSEEPRVTVGRTSHKLRNPANAGPPWASAMAETLRSSPDVEYLTVKLPGDKLGYVERIVTAPLCLTCHGPSVDDDTQGAIRALYPDDQATGFSAGEMRGVFWAEVMP